jgi:uncharacterized damage-inducible protein DinB
MPNQFATTFRAGIASARAKLDEVTEDSASGTLRPGGWNCKQILGHMIDSALNNHQRFVRAALEGKYEGPSYEQKDWVAMHGYADLSWAALVEQWQQQNDLLCSVVDHIAEEKYKAQCTVGSYAPMTLQALMEDYLAHLHQHADQIASAPTPSRLFVAYSLEKMQQMTTQIAGCVQGLTEEQIWQRSGDNANSIGNLLLHLSGNIRQWIGHGIGGLADIRQRDKEFEARGGRSTIEVLTLFQETVGDALKIIQQMPSNRLPERIKPQNREVAILEAIYQVVGHLQLHAGQIIFATKQITGKDLGLFKP